MATETAPGTSAYATQANSGGVPKVELLPGQITGGGLVAEVFVRAGVERIFVLHGAHTHGAVVGCMDRGIEVTLARHEAAAGHAAEGYARAGRRLGVAFATAGPGMTNVVTSMAEAHLDNTPVLYFSGRVQSWHDDSNALQSGVDQVALAKPLTKWAGRAHRMEDIARLTAQAIRIATTPPMGPVFLEIPIDLLNGSIDTASVEIPEQIQVESHRSPATAEIDAALKLLREARRPAIMVGGDVYASGAWDELRAFVQASKLPAFSQFEALGILPPSDPQFAGSFWQLTQLPPELQPDVVLALGVTFGWHAPGFHVALHSDVIHVSTDPGQFGRPRPAKLAILADMDEALQALTNRLGDSSFPESDAWLTDVRAVLADGFEQALQAPSEGEGIHPHRIAQVTCETVGPEAVIVGDGALTKHWLDDAIVSTREQPGTYFTHGSLGCMGFGMGFSVGAALANPGRRTVLFTGDGSFGFNLAELDTMVRHNIPIVIVVANNRSFFNLGRFERLKDGSMATVSTDLGAVDYAGVARSFGAFGATVEREEDIAPAIEEALASGRPAVINVPTPKSFGPAYALGAFRVMQ